MWRYLVLSILFLTIYTSNLAAQESSALAQDALIVDTHIDVPHRVYRNPDTDVTKPTLDGNFDLSRAIEGGLNAAFMSIYIPASVEDEGLAKQRADELIDLVHGIVSKAPERLAMATCVADVYAQKEAGLISFPMGMENGGPLEGDLENVNYFRKRGIRYITLAHSKSNHISDSSYDTNEQWGGLSEFGKQLIPVMNDQGIMVDISHVSDAAAWQVLDLSKVPVIASHSSLRYFVPDFKRNMTDDMVKALGKKQGVIQINYGSGQFSWAWIQKPIRQNNSWKMTTPHSKNIKNNGYQTTPIHSLICPMYWIISIAWSNLQVLITLASALTTMVSAIPFPPI